MIASVECDDCGARMPMREAFSVEEVLAQWEVLQPMVGEGRCTCGGTLREDKVTTLALLEAALGRND